MFNQVEVWVAWRPILQYGDGFSGEEVHGVRRYVYLTLFCQSYIYL